MYLLDTNVVSELRKAKRNRADPSVTAWAGAMDMDSLYLSAITLHEIEYGVRLMELRDPTQGRPLRDWMVHDILERFSARILRSMTASRFWLPASAYPTPSPCPVA